MIQNTQLMIAIHSLDLINRFQDFGHVHDNTQPVESYAVNYSFAVEPNAEDPELQNTYDLTLELTDNKGKINASIALEYYVAEEGVTEKQALFASGKRTHAAMDLFQATAKEWGVPADTMPEGMVRLQRLLDVVAELPSVNVA